MNLSRCLRFAAALSFSFASAAVFAADTIPIGLVAPTSGSVALDGRQEVAGAQFAVDEFNDAGGLNGKKIELFVEDGECRPASSTAAAEKLIVRNQVVAFAGAFCSSATKAVQPISEKHKIPMVNGISSDPSLTDPVRPWFFRTKIHNTIRGNYYAKFIAEDLKLKKLAAIAVDDDFGRSAVDAFKSTLKQYGAEFTLVRYFKHGEVNYISMLNAAKTSDADGLFLVGEAQDGALIMKQYHQLALTMPVVALGSFNTPQFFELAGDAADGIYNAEVWGHHVDNAAAKRFVTAWQAKNDTYPGLYGMSGYVEIKTILKALMKAGSTDSEKVKAALESVSWESPIGVIKFDANHQAHTLMFVTQNNNGEGAVVHTYDTSKD